MMKMIGITDEDFQRIKAARDQARKLLPVEDFRDDLQKVFAADESQKITTPFANVNEKFYWREKELTVFAGYSGHGKSLILGQIAMDLIANHQQKIAIMSLEMPVAKTLERMCQQWTEQKNPSVDEQKHFIDCMDGLYLFDHVGAISADTVYAAIRLSVEKYGVKFFVVDSLMRCGIADDGEAWMSKQKSFVEDLCSLCKETGVHVILVAHMRKPDDHRGDAKVPSKYDIRGFSGITDQADNVFIFWRNKEKEQARREGSDKHADKPDAFLRLDKNRNDGEEGFLGFATTMKRALTPNGKVIG